jgi:hypothetical protein
MIKNKDGTTFKLKGPNPLMKEQDQWGKFVIHNFRWKPEIKSNPIPETNFAPNESKKPDPTLTANKFVSHCLPVIIETHIDELYGDVKSTSKYGNKMMFEFLLVNQNDLSITFWTNIKLEIGSIIYPINKDKRWWKINRQEEKNEGYLYSGIGSDICPDFT